jgi:formamidopyrimidine-DNA glycosylase
LPELPEVETTCKGISPIIGSKIKQIIIRQPKLRWPVPIALLQFKNLTVEKISRRAKYILIYTDHGVFIIHLGMSGRLCLIKQGLTAAKHDHVDFNLTNNRMLRYTDPRRFGSILWSNEDPLSHPLLCELGPEPLSRAFNGQYLFKITRTKTIAIKNTIMDQKIVVGVGNIYANEALYSAGISPIRKTHTLSLEECQALVKSIQKILKCAIIQGGTTLRDFLNADGKQGYFKQKLLVYGRQGELCFTCNKLLSSEKIGQRMTVYCRTCQK